MAGFKRWIDDNDVAGHVDRYSARIYEAVWEQVDGMAARYNLTDFADGFKHFLIHRRSATDPSPGDLAAAGGYPFTVKLQTLSLMVKNREWSEIYAEVDSILKEFLLSREDLVEKAKGIAMQGMEVGKRVFSGGTSMLGGGASIFFSVVVALLSGAAEFLNFLSHMTVFLWLLYYLITSESGGATEQAIGMLPISKPMQARCVEVINEAISSVFVVTAKIAVFQGCLTWLLFRFFSVHFLYTSTVLGFVSPLLPILPAWLATVPAAAQLFVEGRYLCAAAVSAMHLFLMDYGASVIQDGLTGHNSYLTGLSIIGGMALVPNALEGAMMGPIILTLIIAVKNLYTEIVLAAEPEKSSS